MARSPRLTLSLLAALVASPSLPADGPAPEAGRYFKITVVDEETGRGVPLVELRTTNGVRHVTDSNGVVAFSEPGLMGQTVYFDVRSHGYEFAKDGFGFRGKALAVKAGGSARLKIRRLNVAERLYRVTGAGVYRDSLLVGQPVPTARPVLNGQVMGSDSVVNARYRGKVYWFWGDTNRPSYALGNYNVPGATSVLPADGGLDPEAGIDLTYFVDDKGFARAMCPMPGPGPTWIFGLVTLGGGRQRERLFAAYVKVRGQLEIYEHGLAEYDYDREQFRQAVKFPEGAPVYPDGHPFLHTANGTEYVYYASAFPLVRVRADPDRLRDIDQYETFTCLVPGSRSDEPRLDRDESGKLRYAWKKKTPALEPNRQAKLLKQGHLKPEEVLTALRDADTGRAVVAHGGSVTWNEYRQRWVLICVETMGTSFLGEVWYAEADTPLGPWAYARKVVTHDKYSFYNPKQHPFFDKEGGRVIFFEGTYTHTFSGNPEATPRYDYNQVLYKLTLSEPRLVLPVAVYPLSDAPDRFGTFKSVKPGQPLRAAFFAPDRPVEGSVPVVAREAGQVWSLRVGDGEEKGTSPVFHALPPGAKSPPATTVPLYEFVHCGTGRRAYVTDADWSRPGYERAKQPLCLVWRSPIHVALPNE